MTCGLNARRGGFETRPYAVELCLFRGNHQGCPYTN